MSDRPRVVFDCNTLLQAVASPDGPAARCLRIASDGGVDLFTSAEAIAEFQDVTTRPTVAAKLRLQPVRVREVLTFLEARLAAVGTVPHRFDYARDRKDARYVDLAIAVDAAWLVSRDRDLLDLVKPDDADGQRLRSIAPALQICTPPDFLQVYDATMR